MKLFSKFTKQILMLVLFISATAYSQRGLYEPYHLSKAKFENSDFGTMWTFDDVPVNKFEQKYGFKPDEEWLEHAMKGALRFGGGCSAAFVSADGLIMTNHHCIRGRLHSIQEEGENLLRDGYFAETMADERKVPGLFVDQLLLIEDVTEEIISAINAGTTDDEKVANRDAKISELETTYTDQSGLMCRVITLYNGGKYSLYGYKRYKDIRLVMVPDFQIAATGWDWDNFTYPRYELDFAFCRAYDDNGEPIHPDFYFTWSKEGASEDEPIFVVGNPGNTDRLLPYSYLEYLRDYRYPQLLTLFNGLYDMYFELFQKYPERESELLNQVMNWGNARKSYAGSLMALRDEYIMAKKRDFEKQLVEAVKKDPELNKKYGNVWDEVSDLTKELSKNSNESIALMINPRFSPQYFIIAQGLISLAEQMKLPESERSINYKGAKLKETIDSIFPEDFDNEFSRLSLIAQTKFVQTLLKKDHPIINKLYNGLEGEAAVDYLLKSSKLTSKEGVLEMAEMDPDEILNSDDPFIFFAQYASKRQAELRDKTRSINNKLQVQFQLAGEAVFAVFGDQIPPDATGTLRISDGKIKGYEYNGTIAPGKTTFYGLWDRYNSFGGATYPWGLHERWKTPPPQLDLAIPCGFASTNDIVGGNSGSSVINKNFEIVGLVHDGNLESLAGAFIFLPENNRTVATDSWGLIEALKYVYKTDRLVKELQNSKMD